MPRHRTCDDAVFFVPARVRQENRPAKCGPENDSHCKSLGFLLQPLIMREVDDGSAADTPPPAILRLSLLTPALLSKALGRALNQRRELPEHLVAFAFGALMHRSLNAKLVTEHRGFFFQQMR